MANGRLGMGRVWPFVACLFALLFCGALLGACGPSGAALSDVKASAGEIVPGSSGVGKPPSAVEVRYTLGQGATVRATLEGPGLGAGSHVLFEGGQAAGTHILRFNGVISNTLHPGEVAVTRQVVPPGSYNVKIAAGGASETVPIKVGGSPAQPPTLQNVLVKPDIISPNSDALDDVAELTFRTDQTTTQSVDLSSASGIRTAVLAPTLKGPGEQNIVLTGADLLGNKLLDGAYTVTLRLQDRAGNRVEANRALHIAGSGEPTIEIVRVDISPQQVMLGESIAVTVTVKNTGKVPLRTQGPDRGYTYTTNDSYSSVEGGKWVDKAGLWRVGVDWDGNSGGGPPYRYPFRWGFGHTLMPGETAVTGGKITILKQERTMWFYAGVLQEGVRIVLDRLGRTKIGVGF